MFTTNSFCPSSNSETFIYCWERSEARLGPLSYIIPDCDGSTPNQTYAGAAIHADDLRTTAESKDAVSQQANVICNFAKTANLKFNTSKLEIVRIGRQYKDERN